jgi:hypothetical protein
MTVDTSFARGECQIAIQIELIVPSGETVDFFDDFSVLHWPILRFSGIESDEVAFAQPVYCERVFVSKPTRVTKIDFAANQLVLSSQNHVNNPKGLLILLALFGIVLVSKGAN